ncbi:MAG TPA: aromatic ring-hydroxylating dioxygenase subunit alpha [Acidimicrobiia bacterium]|nr:aromatic ring-hydroxylating dioxygenase subunit alpha [Acidimicrobiia bacterium]
MLAGELFRLVVDGPPPAGGPATPVDTAVYTDPDRHGAEIRMIRSHPQAAAHASEVATPGDFVTGDLLGTPTLIVRGADGRLRAFRNACAHRGAPVVTEPRGSVRLLSCGFHGWSYELDGRLRAVASAPLFSTEPCPAAGLAELRCEERHGIVWVTVEPPAGPAGVGPWLGDDLDEVLAALELEHMVAVRSIDFDVSCNWKLLTDGFLELYHLKALHRTTIAPYFPANLCAYRRYGEHLSVILPKNRLVRTIRERPREEWRPLDGLTMPVVLVPATVIQWQAGHVELFSLRPDASDPARSRCRCWLLVPADRAGESELWERNWARLLETIPTEDFAVAERVQRNIDAGSAPRIQIGANEHLLVEHLRAVDGLIGRPSVAAPHGAGGR